MEYLNKHRPCPDTAGCGSSDAYCIIKDHEGVHGFCFSCDKRFEVEEKDQQYEQKRNTNRIEELYPTEKISGVYRNITNETLTRFGVHKVRGQNYICYPYFSYESSSSCCQKIRKGKDSKGKKLFSWRGPDIEVGLFGHHIFPKGSKTITVTTGENDALAVYEMNGDFPVVSLKDGDGSVKRFSSNDYEYLNSFDEIVACFDQDKSGKEALDKFCNLFLGKVKVVDLPKGYIDAHQMLEDGKKNEFRKCWWNRKTFSPNNIVYPIDIREDVLNPPKYEIIPYPWETLNHQIFGLHTPEVITVLAEPKVGKTAHPDTKIIKYNGEIIRYGDVEVGTKLMGPDGTPRTVTRVWKNKGPACKVTLKSGYSFVCKHNHDLWVVNRNTQEYRKQEASTFFNRSKNSLDKDRLTFCKGIEWSNNEKLDVDPYTFGLWLGDGSFGQPSITTQDEEIITYLSNYQFSLGENVSIKPRPNTGAVLVRLKGSEHKKPSTFFKYINTFDCKKIPMNFKRSSKIDRLSLLAGLIDSDGYLVGQESHCYEIIQKSKVLADDIAFIARSLGFQVSLKECQKTCTNNGVTGTYYRMNIQGKIEDIPVLLERKKPKKLRKKSNHMVTFKVEDLCYEKEFVSFELDGDHLYLHENFLVDHNSLFTACIAHHLWKTTEEKIGDISVENTPDERSRTLLSLEVNKPLHLALAGEDVGISKKDLGEAYDKFFSDRRIVLFEKDGLHDPMEIISKINYFVEVLGCRFIIFDHINYLTSYHSEDERKTLDKLSNMLVDLAKDKRINMMIVSHVNDEGKTFGSRNLIKASHTVISLKRDRDNPNNLIRNTTILQVNESRRYGSRIGPPIYLKYNEEQYTWSEIDEQVYLSWIEDEDIAKE